LLLTRVARVPIDFTRHIHHQSEHDEERDCAHQERVILLPQSDVEFKTPVIIPSGIESRRTNRPTPISLMMVL